jgi:hypothetical protein
MTEEQRRISNERCLSAAAMRDAGMVYRLIGQSLGVCIEQARTLTFKGRRLRKYRAVYPREEVIPYP